MLDVMKQKNTILLLDFFFFLMSDEKGASVINILVLVYRLSVCRREEIVWRKSEISKNSISLSLF